MAGPFPDGAPSKTPVTAQRQLIGSVLTVAAVVTPAFRWCRVRANGRMVRVDGEVTASYFDRRSSRYAGADWHAGYAQRLVELADLAVGQRVLDAATGTGFAAIAAARVVGPSGQVVGVDVSTGMLAEAERLLRHAGLGNVSYVEADAATLPGFEDASFEVVLCSAGLLYLPVRAALSTWWRVLKAGGLVGFSTMRAGYPVVADVFRQCAAELGIQLRDPHAVLGDESRCRQALAVAGFRPERVVADQVWLPDSEVEELWRLHVTSPHYPQIENLAPIDLAGLRERFTSVVTQLRAENGADARRAAVIYAFGRKS